MSAFLIIAIGALVVVGIVSLILIKRFIKKGVVTRSLNMSLFSIILPREGVTEDDNKKDDKEKIATMEQFLTSFSSLRAKGLKGLIYGQPYISLEMAVHHKGEEIHTYISVPRSMENVFEKQVHGYFPFAEVQKIDDYNIFHPNGVSIGSVGMLGKSAILPIFTYKTLNDDPLNSIVTSMSKIAEDGEGVALQFIIKQADTKSQRAMASKVVGEMQKGYDFKKALQLAQSESGLRGFISGLSQKKEEQITPEVKGAADEQTIKLIQEKVAKQHFRANIRLIVSAENAGRAEQILSDLESSFVQFSNPAGNSIALRKVPKRNLKQFFFQYAFRIPAPRNSNLISVEELTSMYHFPTSSSSLPSVKTIKYRAAAPPADMPKEGIVLGENLYRGQQTLVKLTDKDRRRHLYIIGQTGTSKTTLIKNLIKQDIESGKGMAVMDPHGELAEYALSLVPEGRRDDIVWFDPGDKSRPFGLNLLEFDPSRPEQKTLVVNELLGTFKKLFSAETMGPMFDQYFRSSTMLLLDDYAHEVPTLQDIPRVLTDKAYRKDKLTRETNPIIKDFWEKEAEKAGGDAKLENIAPYITSKVNGFIADEFIGPIVNQKQSTINFREAMDNNKIVLVNLSKGKLGDVNSGLIGLVIVGKLLVAALSRVDIKNEDDRKDFPLYIDEFQNFTTDSIATILSEARKYRLSLIMAHQFIGQLDDVTKNAVFGNVGSMIALRVSAEDAEYMKNQFIPTFNEADLMNIDNFNANVKLLINDKTATPFNMRILPN